MYDNLKDLFFDVSNKLKDGYELIELLDLMKEYHGEDWRSYCEFCKKGYKRNLVRRDDRIEMLVICWDKGQTSGIHDHPENGCLLKVMRGQLNEKCYDKDRICILDHKVEKDIVSYQIGKEGLHNISNDTSECAVSLHIYAPPNYKPCFYS